MADAFAHLTAPLPIAHDRPRAERTLATLLEKRGGKDFPAVAQAVLEAAFGNSPFLARLAVRDHEMLDRIVEQGPRAALDEVESALLDVAAAEAEDVAMATLRRARRNAALAIALADISGMWSVGEVTRALSLFADASVAAALRFLLRKAAIREGLSERDGARLEAETGLVVLAMGKYGAYELNYSSDIDLIVFYDAERFPFSKKGDARAAAVDIVKGLVKLLAETTADGYVFRVDLRLRPDAGATQIAISTAAAEDYYEGMGQNWERAALIKARACAGDQTAAASFLKAIEPFVWRRNLDYAAIEDIHSIKRQIHAHGGYGAIAVAGHNVKLGRGGIREIEFFVQTQQLILGGRNPLLRERGTLSALEALRARGLVTDEAARELTEAYNFLRFLEHRLQMIEDEQTHTLPKSKDGLAHVAAFCGYGDTERFSGALIERLETVQGHYARLFERAPSLSAAKGSLVFTGVEDDPETIETLANMGFRDPSHVAGAIRGWHHGRIRATRSARARELLTELMPALLDALAATADADAAFAQFDRFLSRLPAGVQLFSLFLANPHLLDLVAKISGSTPRLAEYMARAPATLDALLDPGFLSALPTRAELDAALALSLHQASDFEDKLDAARRFAREQNFRLGAQLIEGATSPDAAGVAFSNIAESVIGGLLSVVSDEVALSAGNVTGGEFVVIAMGKLGGREMTAASDLDLIFVYDAPPAAEISSGPKPLPVSTYYARLAQRFISALTVATGEGTLYEVDMRLRPSGNKGPVAVSLESFQRYQAEDAWTWERLALTRARVVAGPSRLAQAVSDAIHASLTAPHDDVMKEAREMRGKLAAQFPGKSRWDLKFAPGGLVDIEFIVQALQVSHAARMPTVLRSNTIDAIDALAHAAVLDDARARLLRNAARFEQALTQVLKIAIESVLDPDTATEGLKALLLRAAGLDDFALLELELGRVQAEVRRVFAEVFPAPG